MRYINSAFLIILYPFAYLSLLCCYNRPEDREYYMNAYRECIKKGRFIL